MTDTGGVVRRFCAARARRDRLRRERAECFCERAEPMSPVAFEDAAAEAILDPIITLRLPQPTQEEPCWKAARQWTPPTPYSDGGKLYYDPPMSAWCEPCRRRQRVNDELREAIRAHAGALRGLIAHGKTLIRQEAA